MDESKITQPREKEMAAEIMQNPGIRETAEHQKEKGNPENPERLEKQETLDNSESKMKKELSLKELEKVTGGSMRDTIRTETVDITDSVKKRI